MAWVLLSPLETEVAFLPLVPLALDCNELRLASVLRPYLYLRQKGADLSNGSEAKA